METAIQALRHLADECENRTKLAADQDNKVTLILLAMDCHWLGGKKLIRLLVLALALPQPRQAGRCAQFSHFRLLATRPELGPTYARCGISQ